MKVLFVSSGNNANGLSPIVKNQGVSLAHNIGCEIYYFTIQGRGLRGYLQNIPRLRKTYKDVQPDWVHAHYSLCGFVTTLAGISPVIVSLMGSDVKAKRTFKFFILLFARFFWKRVIVKSEEMKQDLGYASAVVIPNGVDLDIFTPMPQEEARSKLQWSVEGKKVILFAANPKRPEKNFQLLEKAFQLLPQGKYLLKVLENVPNHMIPYYLNASDVVVLTSLWEGSPNVIKEAMACNRPIVSTDVGDVKHNLWGLDGCFITSYDPDDVANALVEALKHQQIEGRRRVRALGLSAANIAERIVSVWKS
ncbi:MAG: glycosyl transferase group 1 [Bacteroidetes bacterium]|nr:MAG: glycosyl transferase group 1 [Bacteroidota bacterium]